MCLLLFEGKIVLIRVKFAQMGAVLAKNTRLKVILGFQKIHSRFEPAGVRCHDYIKMFCRGIKKACLSCDTEAPLNCDVRCLQSEVESRVALTSYQTPLEFTFPSPNDSSR